jgi:hypothetical protein
VPDTRTRTAHRRPWHRRLVDSELRETEVIALVVVAGALSGISFLLSGIPVHADTWPHIVRLQATYDALRAGLLPSWSFFFYSGYPLLRFYSPLFYYLGGIICFLTGGDPFQATKVLLFLLHIATGVAFYLFARKRFRSPVAAFIASFAYLFSFVHMFYIQWLSRYPIELCLVLMPLSLWLVDRLLAKPGLSRALVLGIVLALLPLSHILHAVFWLPFLTLWLLLIDVSPRVNLGRRLLWLLVSGAGAVLLSAFFLIPFLIEGTRYQMPAPFTALPAPSVLTMLGLSKVFNGYSGGYFGLSVLILAALGITWLARERRLLRHPGFWGLLIAVLFAFNSRIPLLGRVPVVRNLAPDRFLFFALLFAALLAGYGYQAFAGRSRGQLLRDANPKPEVLNPNPDSELGVSDLGFPLRRWFWLPVLAVLFFDLGPRLITNVYEPVEIFQGSREYIYRKLAGRTDGRLIDVAPEGWWRYGRFPASGYLFARAPEVLGPPYHQFAPRSMLYAYAWFDDLAREFLDSANLDLSLTARRELRLLDARYVVALPARKSAEQGVTYVFLKNGLSWDDTLLLQRAGQSVDADTLSSEWKPLALGTYSEATPVIVSCRVKPRPAAPYSRVAIQNYYIASDWQEFVADLGLDPETGVAERIFTTGLDDSLPGDQAPGCRVGAVRTESERVELQLDVNRDCYARLAYSYYPELRVLDNGRETQVWETADHFLLIRLAPGRHLVRIQPTTTGLRRSTGLLSAAALILTLALLVATRVFRRAGPPALDP